MPFTHQLLRRPSGEPPSSSDKVSYRQRPSVYSKVTQPLPSPRQFQEDPEAGAEMEAQQRQNWHEEHISRKLYISYVRISH